MLACGCFNDEDSDEWYWPPDDFSVFAEWRRKRCQSCGSLVDHHSECLKFICCRSPLSDIEERIEGDEVQLASQYLCEKCGEIYFNLTAAGYCMNYYNDMNEAMNEYREIVREESGDHVEYLRDMDGETKRRRDADLHMKKAEIAIRGNHGTKGSLRYF